MSDETVLEEAARITEGSRNDHYGHPRDNYRRIAGLWSAYLDIEIKPRDVAWMMVHMKSARDKHMNKRDNLVDGAGYIRNAEQLDE